MENINCWESKFQPCQYSDQLLNAIAYLNTKVRIPADIQIIQKASIVARFYHGDQQRKSKEPYYSHPLIVAYLFALYVGNNIQKYYTTELIVIAILHDTIEDTKLTYEMIVEIFGRRVADGVQDLTRLSGEIKTTAADTLNSLFAQYKFEILYIKMFDRLHNILTIRFMSPEKQKKIIAETVSHFIPMATYLGLHEIKHEFERLCKENSETKQDSQYDWNPPIIFVLPQFFSPNLQNEINRIHNL